jgi:hypothetical protein
MLRCAFPIVPMKRVSGGSGSAAAMRSRRGPECLGVRASWPPVVAFVVMDERPAPRCKRRCYRCAVLAQPIRMSTVRYTCAYSLRVSRTLDRKTLRAITWSSRGDLDTRVRGI